MNPNGWQPGTNYPFTTVFLLLPVACCFLNKHNSEIMSLANFITSYMNFLKLVVYLKGRVGERWVGRNRKMRDLSSGDSLPQMPTMPKGWNRRKPEAKNSSQISYTWVAGSSAFDPIPITSQDTVIGGWIWSRSKTWSQILQYELQESQATVCPALLQCELAHSSQCMISG